MAAALTESSTLGCTHLTGSIALNASQSQLTVNGNKVLVDGDLNGASVSNCGTVVTSSTSKCQTFTPMPGGVAQKLKVGGKGVLLETLQGTTDGVPPGGPAVVQSAGQTKLQTA
jgi:hypothetical protein